MKLAFIYAATQIAALAILGFHEPLVLAAIPLGLIANYVIMILFYNFISGRGFRL
jgi:hypothetical protein